MNPSSDPENWLADLKRIVTEVAPRVQEIADVTRWTKTTLARLPADAANLSSTGYDTAISRFGVVLEAALPSLPRYDLNALTDARSLATAASTEVFQHTFVVEKIGTPSAIKFATASRAEYHALQASQNRPNRVKALLIKIYGDSTDVCRKFEVAKRAHQNAQVGVGERSSAAMEMRTLVDVLQAELFKKARQRNAEQNLTWTQLADRLVSPETRAEAHKTMVDQGSNRARLIDSLSAVGKQRKGSGSESSLEDLWAEVLDHLYIVLGLVFPEYE
jgi:hypothetical protein